LLVEDLLDLRDIHPDEVGDLERRDPGGQRQEDLPLGVGMFSR